MSTSEREDARADDDADAEAHEVDGAEPPDEAVVPGSGSAGGARGRGVSLTVGSAGLRQDVLDRLGPQHGVPGAPGVEASGGHGRRVRGEQARETLTS